MASAPTPRGWLAVLLGTALVAVVLFRVSQPGGLEILCGPASESYYNLLSRGFLHGHLSLDRPVPAGLQTLPNPYDPRANEPFREGIPPLHDLSYFEGHLYLYFGVVPAVVLYLPWQALTGGGALPQWIGAWLFSVVGVAALLSILWEIRSRYFPKAGLLSFAAAVLGLGGASGFTLLLARADIYEVAIAGGFCFSSLGLVCLAQALWRPARRTLWLLLAGLAFGLALGCRPNLVIGVAGLVLAALLLLLLRAPARSLRWRWAACLVLPLWGIGSLLLAYNQARFGSVSEFGLRYQLAAVDLSHQHTFSPANVRVNAWAYLWQLPHRLEGFPYLDVGSPPALPAGYGLVEDPFGLVCTAPFLLLGALALGVVARQRRETPELAVLVGAAALLVALNGVLVLTFASACSRYEVEVAPYLAFLAGVAVMAVEARPKARSSFWAFRGVWAVLLAASVTAQGLLGVNRWAHAQSDYAVTLLRAGRTGDANVVLMRARRRAGAVGSIPLNLGYVRLKEGKFAEAAGAFSAAAWIEPSTVEPIQAEVDAWLQGGDAAAALAAVRRGLLAHPGAGGLHARLGFLLGKKGDVAGALAEYATAAQESGMEAPQFMAYGFLLAKVNRMPDAAQAFAEAVRRSPNSAEPRAALGTALAMLGRYEEAVVQFSAALTLNPGDSDSRDNLVEALERLGRHDAALRVRGGGTP